MILTGKAEKDFLIYLKKNRRCSEKSFNEFPEIFENALIIEWFDSVRITIDRNTYDKEMTITNWIDGLEERTFIDCTFLEPFYEWWNEAIETANIIYNNIK